MTHTKNSNPKRKAKYAAQPSRTLKNKKLAQEREERRQKRLAARDRQRKDPLAWRLRVENETKECRCWDCLRKRGITPPTQSKPEFRKDINGVQYATNGATNRNLPTQAVR